MTGKLQRLMAAIACFSILSLLLAACGAESTATTAPVPATATTMMAAPTNTAMMAAPTNTAMTAAPTNTAMMAAPTNTAMMAAPTATAMMAAPTATAMMAAPTATKAMAAATATSGTGTGTGGEAAALPASCSNVELSFWTGFTGPDGPFMQALVDSFNAANPNIKVTHTIQAEYGTQMTTAAASDTLPDLAIANEDVVATYAFNNIIRPMDNAVALSGLTEADFPSVAWNAGEVAGKRYAIPLSFVAMTMYYNEDLLKAAGLTAPPTNKAEFEAAAAAMTSGENKGFEITSGFPVQQIFQQLLHQYGGTEFSADGTQATWNSDAGVQALTWMRDAQAKYSEPNLEVDAELNSFKAGTVGMIWNGSWQLPNMTGDAVSFTGMAAPVPQIGSQPAVWAGGPLLAMPLHKSGVDACKDAAGAIFYRYLIDNSVEWAKAGNVPAYNEARESAEFQALPLAPLTGSVANPVFPPALPGVGDAFAPLGGAVSAIMTGAEADVKTALDTAAEQSNQILAQNKATYGDAPNQ